MFGSGLQHVADGAFMNNAVKNIVIKGDNVVFDKYAFRGSANLQTVVIQSNVSKFDMHAFYGCKDATFFIENNTEVANWNSRWNSSKGPVLSGVTLSQDKTYVESFVKNQDSLVVGTGKVACAPVRDGYVFAGWSTTSSGSEEYTMDTLSTVVDGTRLYAVWNPAAETTN